MNDELVQGLRADWPHQNAPDFVKARLGIEVDAFAAWLAEQQPNERGFVNLDLLESKNGKLYCKLNDWKPRDDGRDIQHESRFTKREPVVEPAEDDDIPF